jgi:hypothetical protein
MSEKNSRDLSDRVYLNNRRIIVINGKPRSGKDAFCKIIERICPNRVYNHSSVTPAKEAAQILGWDGETKDDIARKFISNLKDLSTQAYNHPFKWMKNLIDTYTNSSKLVDYKFILFLHVREPDEIKKLANEYPELVTILMKRPLVDNESYTNHADSDNINKYNYDCVFVNDGTLEDLTELAKKFLNDLWLKD